MTSVYGGSVTIPNTDSEILSKADFEGLQRLDHWSQGPEKPGGFGGGEMVALGEVPRIFLPPTSMQTPIVLVSDQ